MSSVVVVGDIYTLLGRRGEVVELLRETQDRARLEPGCDAYAFAEVVADPGRYIVVQAWRDNAALQAHHASAAFEAYQERVGALLARPSDVRIHHVAQTLHAADPGPLDPRRAD